MPMTAPTILPQGWAERVQQAAFSQTSPDRPITVAIVDGTGWLSLFKRMDGAPIGSIDTAIAKARTAAWFGFATRDLAGAVADGQVLATVQSQPLTFVAGGAPIRDAQGIVIGAIGVGGGMPDEDHAIATQAVAALG